MRAFVALDVSDRVLDSLASFQSELSATGADLKLVERENLHFTIRFLGEISDSEAEEAKARLARLQAQRTTVEVKGVGAFPTPTRPRVVWAGVASDCDARVRSIAMEAIEALQGIGERDERPFQAHITLGRVRSPRNSRELGELLARNSGTEFGLAGVSELKLKSSMLTPRGPIYTDVGVYPLK